MSGGNRLYDCFTDFGRYRGCLGAKLKLKSLIYDRSFNINVGVGYTFSF